MSNYENYSETSQRYDATRIPVGVEIIIGCLAQNKTPLAQQYLLDAGCGTGNYALALLAQVGRISAIDINQNMLNRAREKLTSNNKSENKRIDFQYAPIDALPFDDAVFDGIIINQVLHHLQLASDADYPIYRKVFAEFARVLKPCGNLVVNTCSQQQLRHGFWYYRLIPDETAQMCERHAPILVLQQLMQDVGIAYQQCFVPVDALMQGNAYFNPRGPLYKSWRDGDSIWSTVSDTRIEEIHLQINKLDQSSKLEDYIHDNDKTRQHIGQMSFLHGQRTADTC